MIIVGVTGSIGSGKSTLCQQWEKLGAKVVYADDLAKQLMVTNVDVKHKIQNTFGKKSYHADGSLNKSHLIVEAFKKNRVEELNGIVHPAVAEAFKEICEIEQRKGTAILVKEAALLFSMNKMDNYDVIVIVTSTNDHQVQRVAQRDNVNEEAVIERLEKQPDFEKLKSYADFVVENNGSLEEFEEKAKTLFYTIKEMDKK